MPSVITNLSCVLDSFFSDIYSCFECLPTTKPITSTFENLIINYEYVNTTKNAEEIKEKTKNYPTRNVYPNPVFQYQSIS